MCTKNLRISGLIILRFFGDIVFSERKEQNSSGPCLCYRIGYPCAVFAMLQSVNMQLLTNIILNFREKS